MAVINAKDLRAGHTIFYKDGIYLVLENSFNKTAMREGIVKCKLKNLRTLVITTEVLTGEKLTQAPIEKIKMNFLYQEKDNYVFMDNETYEQISINKRTLGDSIYFLVDGLEIHIMKYENEILGITLPDQISVEIKDAEEAVQGNTVQGVMKKAWLSTGLEIMVPQFIKKGEKVLVNPITKEYISRG